jgi:hypothetical protein
MNIETKDFKVSYEETEEIKKKVFDAVMAYFIKHEAFAGEVIMQDDDCQIYASSVFAKIADDIIKFEVTCKD